MTEELLAQVPALTTLKCHHPYYGSQPCGDLGLFFKRARNSAADDFYLPQTFLQHHVSVRVAPWRNRERHSNRGLKSRVQELVGRAVDYQSSVGFAVIKAFSLRDSFSPRRISVSFCNATGCLRFSMTADVDCGGLRRADSGREHSGIQCSEHGSGILIDHS
jgi:hypothetical protein